MIFSEYKYKIELHSHTSPASRCGRAAPDESVRLHKAEGYSGLVISNHLLPMDLENEGGIHEIIDRWYEDFSRAKEEGDRIGLSVILGAELRFPQSGTDYLIYGIDRGDLYEILPHLATSFGEFRANWHSDHSLVIQAHPCRAGCVPAEPDLIDGVEAFNLHPSHNSHTAECAAFARRVGKIVTAGSDFHKPWEIAMGGIRTKTLPRDSFELAELLRSRDFLLDLGGIAALPEIT